MERCPDCPCEYTPVPADRLTHVDYLLIGEKPGRDENREGRSFCGKTGREVNEGYLPMLSWTREPATLRTLVTATNAIKCWGGPGNKDKLDLNKAEHLERLYSCARTHLYNEIKAIKPKLLIPMGVAACKALDPDIDLEIHHGMPYMTSYGMSFPMYHPAGGLHEPKKMLQIRTDWDRLRKYIKGKLHLPTDPFAGREDYRHLKTRNDVRLSLRGREYFDLGCDTEVKRYNKEAPFCITYSTEPGTANLILASDEDLLREFQAYLDIWRGRILWHNWPFDSQVVPHMGLSFPERLIRDTMQRAFHLGNLPLGLKALAFRELGMLMQDFDDLVTPDSRERCLRFLDHARIFTFPKPPEELVRDDKTGVYKLYKPHSMTTKLKVFWTAYDKNPEGKNVFEAWENWSDEEHAMLEEKCGQWPSKCITYVNFEDALFYACRDADGLVRLNPRLEQMRRRVRRTFQENWRDVA